MVQQTLEQKQQLLILDLQLTRHLPQHSLQDIRIVRAGPQDRKIDLCHVTMMHVVALPPNDRHKLGTSDARLRGLTAMRSVTGGCA
jgi:hypothetical protein